MTGSKRRRLGRADWSATPADHRWVVHGGVAMQVEARPAAPVLPSVLVLEKNGLVGSVVRTALEGAGHDVTVAGTWVEALTAMRADPPGAVVAELDLAVFGPSIIPRLREELGHAAPIIIISGQRQADLAIEVLAHGADDFITTPFSPRELVARLRRRLHLPGGAAVSDRRA